MSVEQGDQKVIKNSLKVKACVKHSFWNKIGNISRNEKWIFILITISNKPFCIEKIKSVRKII